MKVKPREQYSFPHKKHKESELSVSLQYLEEVVSEILDIFVILFGA